MSPATDLSILTAITAGPSIVSYSLTYDKRPWTTNSERAGNRWTRAADTQEWRNAFHLLAKAHRVPPMEWIAVVAQPRMKGRLQDTAACNPAVKAAIDGIVDAGVIPDDTPDFCRTIIFMPPQRHHSNHLELILFGVPTGG